jgi:hypothetical protein
MWVRRAIRRRDRQSDANLSASNGNAEQNDVPGKTTEPALQARYEQQELKRQGNRADLCWRSAGGPALRRADTLQADH